MPPSEDDAHFAEDGTFPRYGDRPTTIVHPSISNDHTLTGSPATAAGGGGSLPHTERTFGNLVALPNRSSAKR